jgi:hypothetical protein
MKKSKILIVVFIGLLITGGLVLAGCEYDNPWGDPPVPPVAYSEPDFYGKWAETTTGGYYLNLTKGMFNWSNRFQMSISSWTKVSCDVDNVYGVSNPEWKKFINCSYKITGTVTNNTLNNNGSSAGYKTAGQTQTLYLHLSNTKRLDWSASATRIYEVNQYYFIEKIQ